MRKDFDGWNRYKKQIDIKNKVIYCHTREIWWSSLGINVGIETNGKNKNFERPVLVLKVYNKNNIVILPLTTKIKDDKYHYKIKADNKIMYLKLTQVRTIDTKRLLRKIDILPKQIFRSILKIWKNHFI